MLLHRRLNITMLVVVLPNGIVYINIYMCYCISSDPMSNTFNFVVILFDQG